MSIAPLPEDNLSVSIVPNRDNSAILHNSELIAFGCRNCVWKQYYQCPHGIVPDSGSFEFIDDGKTYSGYCVEYIRFIQGMACPGDSSSAMWEKFHLYIAELQSMEDFSSLKKLEREVTLAMSSNDHDKLYSLDQKHRELKLWWLKLNENVRLGRQKICDREQKARAAVGIPAPGLGRQGIDFSKRKELEDK